MSRLVVAAHTSLLLAALAAGVGGVGCAAQADSLSAEEAGTGSSTGGAPVELDPVTSAVERTHDATLTSVDGVVKVYVPARGVESTASVTLARLPEERAPSPRVGQAHVLRVEGGTLNVPARVEWRVRADVAVPVTELRVATLDPLSGALVPLPGAQVAQDVVAASVAGSAVLVLVDRRTLPGTVPDVPAWTAGEASWWRGDVAGARAAFHSARSLGPSPQAALGRGLSDLLLLLSRAPVSDVLLRCGLPAEVLLTGLLGPNGAWPMAAEDRAGQATLQVTDASGTRTVRGDEVYTRSGNAGVLQVVRSGDVELRWTGRPATGTALVPEQLGGTLELRTGGDVFRWEAGAAGTLTAVVGRTPGSPVQVTLAGVVLTGEPGSVLLDGTVGDRVGPAPDWLGSAVASAAEGEGAFTRALLHVVDGCSADVTDAWLRGAALQLRDALAPVVMDLEEAGASTAEGTLLEIPQGLTRLPRAVPLGARDARLLASAVRLARAALGAVAYAAVLGPVPGEQTLAVKSLVKDGTRHVVTADGTLAAVAGRAWHLERVAEAINANLAAPVGDPALLEGIRADLGAGLAGVRAAVTDPRVADGLLRWTALGNVEALAGAVALLAAVEASLPSGALPVAIAGAPGFSAALGALLDAPPTHEDLVAGNGGLALTAVFGGSPGGRTAAARDPALAWVDNGVSLVAWNAVFPGPAPGSLDCGAGYACADGFACVAVAAGMCMADGSVCMGADGCGMPADACVQPVSCRRRQPPGVAWEALLDAFEGPRPALLPADLWLLVQSMGSMDPAR